MTARQLDTEATRPGVDDEPVAHFIADTEAAWQQLEMPQQEGHGGQHDESADDLQEITKASRLPGCRGLGRNRCEAVAIGLQSIVQAGGINLARMLYDSAGAEIIDLHRNDAGKPLQAVPNECRTVDAVHTADRRMQGLV